MTDTLPVAMRPLPTCSKPSTKPLLPLAHLDDDAMPVFIVCNAIAGIHKASQNSGDEAVYLVRRELWA